MRPCCHPQPRSGARQRAWAVRRLLQPRLRDPLPPPPATRRLPPTSPTSRVLWSQRELRDQEPGGVQARAATGRQPIAAAAGCCSPERPPRLPWSVPTHRSRHRHLFLAAASSCWTSPARWRCPTAPTARFSSARGSGGALVAEAAGHAWSSAAAPGISLACPPCSSSSAGAPGPPPCPSQHSLGASRCAPLPAPACRPGGRPRHLLRPVQLPGGRRLLLVQGHLLHQLRVWCVGTLGGCGGRGAAEHAGASRGRGVRRQAGSPGRGGKGRRAGWGGWQQPFGPCSRAAAAAADASRSCLPCLPTAPQASTRPRSPRCRAAPASASPAGRAPTRSCRRCAGAGDGWAAVGGRAAEGRRCTPECATRRLWVPTHWRCPRRGLPPLRFSRSTLRPPYPEPGCLPPRTPLPPPAALLPPQHFAAAIPGTRLPASSHAPPSSNNSPSPRSTLPPPTWTPRPTSGARCTTRCALFRGLLSRG